MGPITRSVLRRERRRTENCRCEREPVTARAPVWRRRRSRPRNEAFAVVANRLMDRRGLPVGLLCVRARRYLELSTPGGPCVRAAVAASPPAGARRRRDQRIAGAHGNPA